MRKPWLSEAQESVPEVTQYKRGIGNTQVLDCLIPERAPSATHQGFSKVAHGAYWQVSPG